MTRSCPEIIRDKIDDLKQKHIAKRDKQRFLAYRYRRRAEFSETENQEKRHKHWQEACERRIAGEMEVIEKIEVLRENCNYRILLIAESMLESEPESDYDEQEMVVWACNSFPPPEKVVFQRRIQ